MGTTITTTGMLAASPVDGAEAWAIHDYDGFGGVGIAEYTGFHRVSEVALFIAAHGEIGAALLDHYSGDLDEAREALEDRPFAHMRALPIICRR